MALTRDQQRLIKLDEKILDLEYLYQRELQREKELNKHTLLLSRGFKFRIEEYRRARTRLAKSVTSKPSMRATFAMELSKRQTEYEDAVEELDSLNKDLEQHSVSMLVSPSLENQEKFKELCREIGIQKARVSSKERAYRNWSKKQELVPERMYRNRLPKDYEVDQELENSYQVLAEQEHLGKEKIPITFRPLIPNKSKPWKERMERHSLLQKIKEFQKTDEEIDMMDIIKNPPTQSKESDIPSSNTVRIELEEREQLDAPEFQAQRRRIVIE